jgi:hypothetical protein
MNLSESLRAAEGAVRRARWQVYSRLQRARGAVQRRLDPHWSAGRQLIVCGFPRGGTSLMYNMLSSSLDGFHFTPFEVQARKTIARWGNVASKWPLDIFYLEGLVRRNIHGKQLSAIVMLRDPRDLITSVHPNVPDRYFIDYEGCWTPHRRGARREAFGIRQIHTAIERAECLRGIEVVLLRYEELVADPDTVQELVSEQLDLTFRCRFSAFHKYPDRHAFRFAPTEVRAPDLVRANSAVDRSRQGKWRRPEHAQRIASHFSEHPELFRLVRQMGYEQDDSWFAPYCTLAEGPEPLAKAA